VQTLGTLVTNSIINCHAVGLDSIMLKPSPNMLRIFVVRENHTLWRNNPDTDEPWSIGLHPHHCDITMVPIHGRITNIVLGTTGPQKKLHQFEYRTGIVNRVGAFKSAKQSGFGYVNKDVRVVLKHEPLRFPQFMAAKQMHSVYVPKGQRAAWLICEGREWPEYQPVTLSNHRLDKDYSAVAEDLYKPMTMARLTEYGEWLGVYLPGINNRAVS